MRFSGGMTMTKTIRFFLAALFLVLFSLALALTASAQGYHNVYPAPASDAEETLITAEPLSVRDGDGIVGITARYSVNREALATLEADYKVTFGVLVARAKDGYTQTNLTLTYDKASGSLQAPLHAAVRTVYSTGGAHTVDGTFLTAEKTAFSATLNIGTKTVDRSRDGAVHLAFLLLEDPDGIKEPRFLYIGRKGTSFGATPSLEGAAQYEYNKNKDDATVQEAYLSFLKEQMKSTVDDVASLRVLTAGDRSAAATLEDGERAIWVQYLPNKDPYPNATDALKENIRAAYIYYPLDFDPTTKGASELVEMGVKRVFAYIGTVLEANSPALVCVHGGGGHAYARYVHEAMKNGYSAIAIDTEGHHNTTGGTMGEYSEDEKSYIPDTLGHIGKDGFANAEKSLSEQWLYYAVTDTALANSVLRSLPTVDAEKVGITGISWGGLVTTTALCYDHRYAFAAPVYISFHMTESYGTSLGGIVEEGFASRLWQDASLLSKCPVPTMIISSESDMFASVDTISKTAKDLPNAFITVKPDLNHGQQYGASLAEIYHFGHTVLGTADGFVTPENAPTKEMGREYTLSLRVPEGGTDVYATLYYRTSPLAPYKAHKALEFYAEDLLVNEDGTVEVTVPEDACLYFLSFSYFNEEVYNRKAGTPYIDSDHYARGYLYSSTDLVFLNE